MRGFVRQAEFTARFIHTLMFDRDAFKGIASTEPPSAGLELYLAVMGVLAALLTLAVFGAVTYMFAGRTSEDLTTKEKIWATVSMLLVGSFIALARITAPWVYAGLEVAAGLGSGVLLVSTEMLGDRQATMLALLGSAYFLSNGIYDVWTLAKARANRLAS